MQKSREDWQTVVYSGTSVKVLIKPSSSLIRSPKNVYRLDVKLEIWALELKLQRRKRCQGTDRVWRNQYPGTSFKKCSKMLKKMGLGSSFCWQSAYAASEHGVLGSAYSTKWTKWGGACLCQHSGDECRCFWNSILPQLSGILKRTSVFFFFFKGC